MNHRASQASVLARCIMLKEALNAHQTANHLVSIHRDLLPHAQRFCGYVVLVSAQLVLLQSIIDFRCEGFVLLRLRDITDILTDDKGSFCEDICRAQGLPALQSTHPFATIDSMQPTLALLQGTGKLLTLQCEGEDAPAPQQHCMGKIVGLSNTAVTMQAVASTGHWHTVPQEIPFSNITLLLVEDNYARMFQQYMPSQEI